MYSEKKSNYKLGGGLSRYKRVDERQLPGLRLTPRDAAILMAVYQYRALTTKQIETLFFLPNKVSSKPNTRCQYRLQLLYQHGYLLRDEQPQKLTEGRKPFVYWLNDRGAQLVEELLDGDELDWNPSEHHVSNLFLVHLLATNDVRVAITIAAQKHNFSIDTWLDDRTLKRRHMTDVVTLRGPQGGTQKAAVVPDGFFVLNTPSAMYHHCLEIDLATVTGLSSVPGRRDIARKIRAYLAYFQSGKYEQRYGTYKGRVLIVTTGEKRVANLKAITENVGGKQRFWLTTLARVQSNDVLTDPIWQKAGDAGFHTLIW